MITAQKAVLTVEALIGAPVEKVWIYWTDPKHIVNWNYASSDWYTPEAENDLRTGGPFRFRMESRDGANGFNFSGKYDQVIPLKQISYRIDDGRMVHINFISEGNQTIVSEKFEAEQSHSAELQKDGWQRILNNFKDYVEKSAKSDMVRFEIIIHADRENVFRRMIDEKTYQEWTAVFNPFSHYEGSWEKDSVIHFLGESKEGSMGGMVSRIRENIPGHFISIEHIGIIENGNEVLCGPMADEWKGTLENYSFFDNPDGTLLRIEMDVHHQYADYFRETWPRALDTLKSICES